MKNLLAVILTVTLLGGAAHAAQGAATDLSGFSTAEKTKLLTDIEAARRANPGAFRAFTKLRDQMPALDKQKRGRIAPVTPMFKALGESGLMPMLEALAVNAPAKGRWTDSAWKAYRVGMLEAVGELRDARAAPVLYAVLTGRETDPSIHRAASGALALLGDEAWSQKIADVAAKSSGEKRAAVLEGLGNSRRVSTVKALAEVLATKPDDATALACVKALANAGNAWAWEAMKGPVKTEEDAARAIAAKALVGAFVAYDTRVRDEAGDGVLVVDHVSTPELIKAVRVDVETVEQKKDLDALAERFARNPARTTKR